MTSTKLKRSVVDRMKKGERNWKCARCEKGKGGMGERAKRMILRILQWNADGIGNKGAELEECMIRMNVHLAMIQKSKLGVNRRTPMVGYVVVRKDIVNARRSRERIGGGLVTVKWMEWKDN